jgi:Putative Actinobacterial Holin-X, holin superfamily III
MDQDTQNSNSMRDQSTGDLVKALSEQTSLLVRKEVDLAKAELTEKGKKAGVGAGMFGAGGILALFGLAVLTAALVAGLSEAMDTWLAALIVGVIYLAGAGFAALMGREKIREATPLAPEQAIETTKEDVQWAKTQIRSETR